VAGEPAGFAALAPGGDDEAMNVGLTVQLSDPLGACFG